MTGAWSYLVIALASAMGGYFAGYNMAGNRMAELEARIVATESAVLRQGEMIERLVSGLTNIVVIAESSDASDPARSIAMLARNALKG